MELTIICDSREKTPYNFATIKPKPTLLYKGLKTGDYSLDAFEDKIAIERKSHADLCGSVGQGRKRLQAEFERLSTYEYAAIVIECSLSDIFLRPTYSKMNPKSILRTLTSWSIRYGVCVWPCPDRIFAERLTYILLSQFYKQSQAEE